MKTIHPFNNPWREIKKNPAHAQLALLWSEKNQCDILAIGKRRLISDWIFNGIGVLTVLFVMAGLLTYKLTIPAGLYITVGMLGVFVLVLALMDSSWQKYHRFQHELYQLVNSDIWDDVSEKGLDVATSKSVLRNSCADCMARLCQSILTSQQIGDRLKAASLEEDLRESSGHLNSFGLGDEWKVYFAMVYDKIGGDHWEI